MHYKPDAALKASVEYTMQRRTMVGFNQYITFNRVRLHLLCLHMFRGLI
jgi:hypothetical protein